MVTPFLKPFNSEGGTLYVFPSASQDLTKTLVSNDYEFKFSHFACLNLPDIYSGAFEEGLDKGLYLGTFGYTPNAGGDAESVVSAWSNVTIENAITDHLQNYVMNFETAILNGEGDNDDYDNDVICTVSEKVFFNWLKKVGGIKFSEDGKSEYEDQIKDRTIQYIGNIDVMNTVEVNGDSFNELYLHIPSSVGASTYVYFRNGSETDNKNYLNKYYSLGEQEGIIGRIDSDNNVQQSPYTGISSNAIYDLDTGVNIYTGDSGHTIDFRDTNYFGGEGISNMNEYSTSNFQFNAILIYYDFLVKTNTPGVKKMATNLYGILFLKRATDENASSLGVSDEREGRFEAYPKYKDTLYGNGNSYTFKIDLKVDTNPDKECVIEKYDDPNSCVSFFLYEKALVQMQKCMDLFFEQKKEIVALKQRINELETLTMGIDTMDEMKKQLQNLQDAYDTSVNLDTDDLLGLIQVNSDKLDSIMHGGKNIKLQYDTDVIKAGAGVTIDKKDINNIVISANLGYSITPAFLDEGYSDKISYDNYLEPTSSVASDCYIKLKPGENLSMIYVNDEAEYSGVITVHIDDSENEWKKGQSIKLCFRASGDDTELNFEDSMGVEIKIDNSETISIPGNDLMKKSIIEIIYAGDSQYIYLTR